MTDYARLTGNAMKEWLLERTEMVPFSGCWIWTGAVNSAGYGNVCLRREGKQTWKKAHRLMFAAEYGKIPEGMNVCHKCDVPSCINPAHLFLGTQKDNQRDAARKGRMARGELGGMAKLTERQVREIRARYAEGGISQAKLG